MKKLLLLSVVVGSLYCVFKIATLPPSTAPDLTAGPPLEATTPTPTQKLATQKKESILVPYWALGQYDISTIPYDTIYYFGLAVDEKGIVINDPGYMNLAYTNCPNDKICVLVLRMLNNDANKKILADPKLQTKIIDDSITIANKYYYSGVALDLELSELFNSEITTQITKFVQQYYTMLHKDYKTLSFITYGDSYFRKRPFDTKSIGESTDEVMIMAYDFHKSYGEPGPNFSFDEKSKYGYDFKQMITDFSGDVSREKITVIFGMYGYDWTLNKQGTPLKRAEAITLNQITNSKFQITNQYQNSNSKERRIEYIDQQKLKHVIWYENKESAEVKTQYLQENGIGSVSYWAWGYF
ncbi:hypothetical protein COY90_04940 [Candidatus Roizmanbacteria bacterium CG_4_10_14_0_8_um_filter_39_9]|uniref:GH18 domain-containing protein n=1 Tax=Candidatus Roizmanbacteria bacterium CG_4_10_14_0_8_um_filter_39_9 TaxID=1974829 RepID=A0A2M7QCM9_9BACT|nr:MAG: hypothetical protein COY90_04940 [Candidatus Roizmanbacteria bacterium CG_4_10_14_0_8_um_filter_39_9]